MPRKKITESEGMEQATGIEQSGLTGENVDATAIPDETTSQDLSLIHISEPTRRP